MTSDYDRLCQLLVTGGPAFRVSELQRAHEFCALLEAQQPSFHAQLREALRGGEVATDAGDQGVTIDPHFELGFTLAFEEPRAIAEGRSTTHRVRVFSLAVEGRNLNGNASVEQFALELDEEGAERERTLTWRLDTNETWPTRVDPFIRRGESLDARIQIEQLLRQAEAENVSLEPALLEQLFAPISARLLRIYRALRGR